MLIQLSYNILLHDVGALPQCVFLPGGCATKGSLNLSPYVSFWDDFFKARHNIANIVYCTSQAKKMGKAKTSKKIVQDILARRLTKALLDAIAKHGKEVVLTPEKFCKDNYPLLVGVLVKKDRTKVCTVAELLFKVAAAQEEKERSHTQIHLGSAMTPIALRSDLTFAKGVETSKLLAFSRHGTRSDLDLGECITEFCKGSVRFLRQVEEYLKGKEATNVTNKAQRKKRGRGDNANTPTPSSASSSEEEEDEATQEEEEDATKEEDTVNAGTSQGADKSSTRCAKKARLEARNTEGLDKENKEEDSVSAEVANRVNALDNKEQELRIREEAIQEKEQLLKEQQEELRSQIRREQKAIAKQTKYREERDKYKEERNTFRSQKEQCEVYLTLLDKELQKHGLGCPIGEDFRNQIIEQDNKENESKASQQKSPSSVDVFPLQPPKQLKKKR